MNPWTAADRDPIAAWDAIQANHDMNRAVEPLSISAVDAALWLWIARKLTGNKDLGR